MTGLLAKLVARAHGTLPEVAPRPVSRFETDDANAEMVTNRTLEAFRAALPEELADIPISHSINALVTQDTIEQLHGRAAARARP